MDVQKKTTARVIRKFHGMPWLKKESSHNGHAQRVVGPGGEILSLKKTDEDYFPGTKDEKRAKRKRQKKAKAILTLEKLDNLMKLTPVSSDSKEELNLCSNSSNCEENALITSVPASSATVWSKDAGIADKLFPNVQSVVIDREDEAEMMSRAIAESIATIQLEKFNRPTIAEENQWEPLYGDADDEDDGGWDNVRRNLPSPLNDQASNSTSGAIVQKSCDDNNNSSKSGILRNKQNNIKRSLTEPESLDFGFRKLSESLKQEIKAGRSLKSVSFSEALLVKDPSTTSSENDEPDKIVANGAERKPNIDKFGRVDGYSEKRLFMGKGARMKELDYIKSRHSTAVQDVAQQNLEPKLRGPKIPETLTHSTRKSRYDEHPEIMKPVQDFRKLKGLLKTGEEKAEAKKIEAPKTGVEKPGDRKSVKPMIEEKDPQAKTLEEQKKVVEKPEAKKFEKLTTDENSEPKKPEKPTTVVENPKAEKTENPTTVVSNPPVKLGVPEDLNDDENYVEKLNKSTFESSLDSTESSISLKSETKASEKTESKVTKIKNETMESFEKTECETLCEEPTRKINRVVINGRKIEMVSCGTQTMNDDNDKPGNETSLEDSQNNNEDKKIISKDSTPTALTKNVTKKEIPDKESNAVGRCLVPTLIREDTLEENISVSSFRCTESLEVMPEADFRSAACQNLLLTGASYQDAIYETNSSQMICQNLQNQNYFVPSSAPFNTLPIPYQALNNTQQFRQMPNYGCSTPPNYVDTNYAYVLQRVELQNMPYQIANGFGTQNDILYKPMERREDFNELRFMGMGVPPSFVKKSILPPGFTRAERNPDKDDFGINSSESSSQNVSGVRDEAHEKESAPSQSTIATPRPNKETKRLPRQRNQTQDVPKPEMHHKSETGSRPRDEKEMLRSRRAGYMKHIVLNHLKKRESHKASRSQRDNSEEKSSILGEYQTVHSSNNNYLCGESVNSALSSPPQSEIPVVYQIPSQQSTGFGYATNWQYATSPGQTPGNYMPSYQCGPLIPNSYNLASGSYNPMHHQLRSQMQAAGNSPYPYAPIREEMNNVESRIVYPEINSHLCSNGPSVEMVHAGISRCQVQSAAYENQDLNTVTMGQSAPKAPKGRGRGRFAKYD